MALDITEIFYSLQGESRTAGIPTAFIRLAGCPLRCSYCDTCFAYEQGKKTSVESILDTVAQFQPRYVTVTGGEPLAQDESLVLMKSLCDTGYNTSLETGGMLDISQVDPRVVKVVDLKTPGSGECESNDYDNINHLQPHDQIKFVICSEEDYTWAKEQLEAWELVKRCEILFSPCHGHQNATELAEWVVQDNLPVRFQLQLHKQLWGDKRGK